MNSTKGYFISPQEELIFVLSGGWLPENELHETYGHLAMVVVEDGDLLKGKQWSC